jgi:hypothetical protein
MNDALPNSLTNSIVSIKVKIVEKGVGVCSLICNTSGVRGACWSFRMGTKMNDQYVNYSNGFAQTKQQVG